MSFCSKAASCASATTTRIRAFSTSSTTAATSRSTINTTTQILPFLQSSAFRWAVSGWSFFIIENAVLSENRTWIIEQLGNDDDKYHVLYGTFSTAAMASIGYSYYKLTNSSSSTNGGMQQVFLAVKNSNNSKSLRAVAFTCMGLGLIMASQSLPKLQFPWRIVRSPATSTPDNNNNNNNFNYTLSVQCPFDFGKDKMMTEDGTNASMVHGLERITRHPGLWSLACISAAFAPLQTSLALRTWYLGPTAIAWLGGNHTDSRFRRGIGGTLDPVYGSQTSNVPFVALITGKQGSVQTALAQLGAELKPLNAALATAIAAVWIVSRGRVVMPVR